MGDVKGHGRGRSLTVSSFAGYLGYSSGFSLSCMVFFLIAVSHPPCWSEKSSGPRESCVRGRGQGLLGGWSEETALLILTVASRSCCWQCCLTLTHTLTLLYLRSSIRSSKFPAHWHTTWPMPPATSATWWWRRRRHSCRASLTLPRPSVPQATLPSTHRFPLAKSGQGSGEGLGAGGAALT